MVVTFLTYTAAGKVLLQPCDAAKPAHRETDVAYLDSSTVLLEENPARATQLIPLSK